MAADKITGTAMRRMPIRLLIRDLPRTVVRADRRIRQRVEHARLRRERREQTAQQRKRDKKESESGPSHERFGPTNTYLKEPA